MGQVRPAPTDAGPGRPPEPSRVGDAAVRHERDAVVELFRLFNLRGDLHAFLADVTRFLAGWAGFEAVGVRLHDDGDYPYFETVGFPQHFTEAERSLCAHAHGRCLTGDDGKPVLECACGAVLRGDFIDPGPDGESAGSFVTNSTTALLRDTPPARLPPRLRARCNREGYESVGLFPIRLQGETLGLLQLNDRRPDRFTPEVVATFERVAESLALALAHRRAEAQLARSLADKEALHAEVARRAEEAERANQAKDVFLAMLSHELRTPLNSILLNLQLLRSRASDEARVLRVADAIERGARAQTQLIADLLDVSRIVSGKLQLVFEAVEVDGRVRAAADTLRPQAEERAVELDVQVVGDGPFVIRGDPARVQQIVWNLVGNAIKFTPDGGRVTVTVDRADERVRVRVADTGIGIPPEFLPHVFDRFAQADSSSTRKHGGLGLGLAIVRHLVTAHGGTIEADSPGVDRGATFTVTFPPATVEAPDRAAPRDSGRTGLLTGLRVLLVDDDQAACETMGELCADAGARVRVAFNAADAFTAVDRFRPDVLLVDLSMPGEDGYSLLKRLEAHASPAARHARAIAVTAMASENDRRAALAAGFVGHVPKPVDMAKLVRLIVENTR